MENQTTLEGVLVAHWIHEPINGEAYQCLRLAHHRPGTNPIISDYVTVRMNPDLVIPQIGLRKNRRIIIRGRLVGRDIPETLGKIISKSGHQIDIPEEIAGLAVLRPTTEIQAVSFELSALPKRAKTKTKVKTKIKAKTPVKNKVETNKKKASEGAPP